MIVPELHQNFDGVLHARTARDAMHVDFYVLPVRPPSGAIDEMIEFYTSYHDSLLHGS